MKRFFGMIPIEDIKKELKFNLDSSNRNIVNVQVCDYGWTIIFPGNQISIRDADIGADGNLEDVRKTIIELYPEAREITNEEAKKYETIVHYETFCKVRREANRVENNGGIQ